MLVVAYAPTAGAHEPPENPTPEAEGRDDPDQGEIYAPAPTGLSVTGSTDASVSLSWNPVTNAYRYKLERSTSSSGPWTDAGSETGGTSGTATGLDCDTTYYFRVSTRGDGSPYSATFGDTSSAVSRATSECSTAPAPTGLSVTGSTDASVSLSWNPVTNAYRYKLERSTSSSGPWTDVGSETGDTSGTATGLDCGTTYYFRVSARGDGTPYSTTFGDPSSSVSRATSACLPTIGVDVQSPFVGQAVTMTVSTTGSSGTVSSYQWQEWSAGSWTDLGATTTSATRSESSSVAGYRSFKGSGRVHLGDAVGVLCDYDPVAGDERGRHIVSRLSAVGAGGDEHGYAHRRWGRAVGRRLSVAGVVERRMDGRGGHDDIGHEGRVVRHAGHPQVQSGGEPRGGHGG